MRRLSLSLVAAVFLAAPALAHDYKVGDIRVDHPFARATPPMANVGGGYMVLHNDGAEADRLLGGSTPAAERVEIHSMEMDGDVARMRQIEGGLDVPAGGTLDLTTGGYHLMLVGLAAPLKQGESVPLTLEFEKAGALDVTLSVEAMGARRGASDPHAGH